MLLPRLLSLPVALVVLLSSTGVSARNEDAIPVIEIRGEGRPMSAAQIRHLEEMSNGGPLDIKVEKQWRPADCEGQTKRKDFLSFHYKLFLENGHKIFTTYTGEPVQIQLGVGMTIPGLDKGLQGMCRGEQRRVSVPWRLAQKKNRGKVWKHVPAEEHWLRFDVELMDVTAFSLAEQFKSLDVDGDTFITEADLVRWSERMKEDFGKQWRNEDVDNVIAAKYYIKYFDESGDGRVDFGEFQKITERDESIMTSKKDQKKPDGRKRDPGFAWILDFDNDGIASYQESDDAPELLEKGPTLPANKKDEL